MLSKIKAPALLRGGAVIVVAIGLLMLSQGRACPLHASNRGNSAGQAAPAASPAASPAAPANRGPQVIRSSLAPYGYPNITVEAGRPVKWIIDAPPWNINGCNYRFVVGEYGIRHEFKPGENVIEFTPKRAGKVPYSCWMGMIPGTITVVEGK